MEARRVICLTVIETAEYAIELDPETLDEHIPEELLDSPDDLRDWLTQNEDPWLEEIGDGTYQACLDREITKAAVISTLKREEAPEMKTTTFVCDWFSPNDDARPLIIVLETPDDWTPNGLDNIPELWTAFLEKYGKDDDYGINPEMCVSEYVYEVFSVEIDLSSFESCTEADWLRVNLAKPVAAWPNAGGWQ